MMFIMIGVMMMMMLMESDEDGVECANGFGNQFFPLFLFVSQLLDMKGSKKG